MKWGHSSCADRRAGLGGSAPWATWAQVPEGSTARGQGAGREAGNHASDPRGGRNPGLLEEGGRSRGFYGGCSEREANLSLGWNFAARRLCNYPGGG